jgi:hypothetical protein
VAGPPPAEEDAGVSWRARAFLGILAFRHLGVGVLCLFAPHWFTSSSYDVIRRLLPLQVWGVLLVLVGLQAIGALSVRGETWARVVLIASASLTAAWAAGFIAAAFSRHLDAPPLPITWAALTGKDLIVSALPLRTPLEDVARRRGYVR